MFAEISQIFTILTVIIFVFLSGFLLTRKKGNRLSSILLAAFLLANALDIFENVLIYYELRQNVFAEYFRWWGFPFFFLYIPLLWFYVRALTDSQFKLKWNHVVHAIPFLAILVYLLIGYHFHSPEVKIAMRAQGQLFNGGIFDWNLLLVYHNLQFLAYLAAILLEVKKYRVKLKSFFSAIENIKLSWLSCMLMLFLVVKIFDLVNHLLMFFDQRSLLPPYIILREAGFLIFAIVVVIKSVRQPVIHFGENFVPGRSKYKTSPLTPFDRARFFKRIEQVMQQKKLFLDPQFSLKDLARQTSIPAQYISQILNESLKKNFFDFVNGYRIEEARSILKNSSHSRKNVPEVCFQVGFNSKTTFNRIFKKLTRMTPAKFKERYLPR